MNVAKKAVATWNKILFCFVFFWKEILTDDLCIASLPLPNKKTNPGEKDARENQVRELQNISEEKI